MRSRLLVLLPLLFATALTSADDALIYESLAGVTIGRVFLTQAERERLDMLRRNPPSSDVAPPSDTGDTIAQPDSKPPAGFIVSSRGQTRVWRNGDFVDATPGRQQKVAFPGDVQVTRHQPEADDGEKD